MFDVYEFLALVLATILASGVLIYHLKKMNYKNREDKVLLLFLSVISGVLWWILIFETHFRVVVDLTMLDS